MRFLYIVVFWYTQFIKQLYKKRGLEVKINSQVLSLLLFTVNVHTILIFIEFIANISIGVSDFWNTSGKAPKSIHGILVGSLLGSLYFLLTWFLDKKIKNKFSLNRIIINKQPNRFYSLAYLLISIIFMFISIVIMFYSRN